MTLPDYDGAGVYLLDFGVSRYVGSSHNVRRRLLQHQRAARRGKEHGKLQAAFDRHGEPTVRVLVCLSDDDPEYLLREREAECVAEYAADLNGSPLCGHDGARDLDSIRHYANMAQKHLVEVDRIQATADCSPEYRAQQIASHLRHAAMNGRMVDFCVGRYLMTIREGRDARKQNRQA